METPEKHLQELQELGNMSFTLLKQDKQKKDFTVSFPVYDYYHLMGIISSLMKLCAIAVENEATFDDNSKIDIADILKIAIVLLPIDEAEFLDKARELFLDEKRKDTSEKHSI
ncbi:hypothetical protein BC749_1234 [Flavobacterium araucananum]|nr:hypothetical protein [Flavobacterium araucananum]PWJ89346.1 hypothetical protein BC749_1234 [Flavobacterium araucananum]